VDGLSHFDLAVVGAGIVGATVTAEARRRRPRASVLLLDQSLAGSGATRYSAALSTPTGASPAHRRLVQRAGRWYSDLERTGAALPRRSLLTYWVVGEASAAGFTKEFVSDPPVPAANRDLARLRELHSDLAIGPAEVVFRSDGGVWAGSAADTAKALAYGLNQAEGCGCREGVRVEDVEPEGDAFLLRTHTGDRLRSRHVVLATGPWLADDPGQGPLGWGLRVKKVAALHLALRPRAHDPAIVFWDEDAFLLPMPAAGFTLFSFHCDTWDVRPESADLVVERSERDAALGVLARRSTRLAASHAGGRAFCDGYLPGRLPLVCEDPARPGVLLAGGCSGSGFRLAPALAELALDRLDRFAEG